MKRKWRHLCPVILAKATQFESGIVQIMQQLCDVKSALEYRIKLVNRCECRPTVRGVAAFTPAVRRQRVYCSLIPR